MTRALLVLLFTLPAAASHADEGETWLSAAATIEAATLRHPTANAALLDREVELAPVIRLGAGIVV
jgi:hypothetical protein